jgi:PhoH-like ATPase
MNKVKAFYNLLFSSQPTSKTSKTPSISLVPLSCNFEKVFVLDTNIVLNDAENIEILSQQSNNLIVLPETMLDETDAKKSGVEEINFMARAFGRLLEQADVIEVRRENGVTINRCFINSDKNITIDIISISKYAADSDRSAERSILNDRKIIEVAQFAQKYYNKPVVFVSLDVMCRHRAVSLGIDTESFGKDNNTNIELYSEVEYEGELPSSIECAAFTPDTLFGLCLYNAEGNRNYYYKSGIMFHQVDEVELKRQNIKPMNIEQKIYSSMINDNYYDVIICDSPAGSGKTLVALSAAMKLIDKNGDKYNKIVYMRKTVTADNEEMGFLPGSEAEKYAPYLAPLYSNLEYIVTTKYKKKMSTDELQEKIDGLVKDYNITTMFEGFLRGTNIASGSIVIIDEIQNEGVSSIRTSLTRVTEGCKVILIGSNKQIDNKYINKHTSALTYVLNKIGCDNNNVHIGAIQLTKTVRGRIAEWADDFK